MCDWTFGALVLLSAFGVFFILGVFGALVLSGAGAFRAVRRLVKTILKPGYSEPH
jgi:hypothetical protein